MATIVIVHSVGAWHMAAKNRKPDVIAIQRGLQKLANAGHPEYDPGIDDGFIARRPGASQTVRAIEALQRTFMRNPDGLVEPKKKTLQKLNEKVAAIGGASNVASPSIPPVVAAPKKNPPQPTILGIHSNVVGDRQDYTAGHAWLSITEKGKTGFYGLWPDAHPNVVDNGDKSDIRIGMEASSRAAASRFYKLSPAQAEHFWALMQSNVTWRYTNTCASWASEVVESVVGEDVDSDDYMGFETPRELGSSILELEKKDPTGFNNPKQLNFTPNGSSW